RRQGDPLAPAAPDDVVFARPPSPPFFAPPAEELFFAVAAGDGVVPRAAVHGKRNQGSKTVAGGEGVAPAVHVDDQILTRADVDEERGRADAVEADAGAIGRDGEDLAGVSAVDLAGVAAVTTLVEVAAVPG